MARKPQKVPGRKARVPGNPWADRFYNNPPVDMPDWEPTSPVWTPTHVIGCEHVRVLEDRTHQDYGFLYGEAYVESSNGERRWVHFGRFNYQEMRAANA